MTGRIIYYICDGCKKNTLTYPELELVITGEHDDRDYHICADCADSDWFWCKRCETAHQFECPVDAAKADAEWKKFQEENAAQFAEVKARNDALPF